MILKYFTVFLICILVGIEADLFTPSFPELQESFKLTPFMVQLTLSVNFIAYCIGSLFSGMLGDKFNRRIVIINGLLIFAFGSLLCVIGTNFLMILLGRFFQGIGIAIPSVLIGIIFIDEYPFEKQAGVLGRLNGYVSVAMSLAPVFGSYINFYFNWRASFISLLVLSLICLFFSLYGIPNRKGDPAVSLSLKTYLPLLKSRRFLGFMMSISLLSTTYCVFIGMASILYREDLNVSLRDFGYYQGALAGVFSIVSFFSPVLLRVFKPKKCFYVSIIVCIISSFLIISIAILDLKNPGIITGAMMLFSGSVVLPFNILYVEALGIIKNSKGKVSALILSSRLILSSVGLSLTSYYYGGTFFPIGLWIFLSIILAVFIIIAKLKIVGLSLVTEKNDNKGY